jgi:hypothetical protein
MGKIEWLLESSPWVRQGVIVLAACACAACIFYVVKRLLERLLLGRPYADRKRALADFNKMILVMSRQLQILDTQSKEYFATLHENGLTEILRIHDSLLVIVSDLTEHLMERRLEQFDELLGFVARPDVVRPEAQLSTGIDLSSLLDWARVVDQRSHDLMNALLTAQKKTQALGISRPHKEVPTVAALKELRALLKADQGQESPSSKQTTGSGKVDTW